MNKLKSNRTCFSNCKTLDIKCKNMSCRQWFNNEENNNCAIIAAELGPMTLQNIGNLFSLTRMRICQIEKNAMKKIREIINP
jgi:uncharacterized protein YqkB